MLITALGSSFAAGPTLEPIADRAAMRSARNYPHLLADALGASLVDLTVSGATTTTILDVPQVIAPRVQFAPQIDGLPPDADLVTITAGGNDLKFIGSMLFTAWRRHDPAGALTKLMRAGLSEARRATDDNDPDGVPAATPGVVAEVAAGLARIVAAARSRAPGARVLLVDYLTVLDAHSRSALVDFAADELGAFRALQSALVQGYAVAARHSGADRCRRSAGATAWGPPSPGCPTSSPRFGGPPARSTRIRPECGPSPTF